MHGNRIYVRESGYKDETGEIHVREPDHSGAPAGTSAPSRQDGIENFPRRYYPDRVRRDSLSLARRGAPRIDLQTHINVQSTPVSSKPIKSQNRRGPQFVALAQCRAIAAAGACAATRLKPELSGSRNNPHWHESVTVATPATVRRSGAPVNGPI